MVFSGQPRLFFVLIAVCGCVFSYAQNVREVLYNGIEIPAEWPPRYSLPAGASRMPLPYVDNRPEVIPINVGRQLFVDDFLVESTDMVRVCHHARMYEGNPVIVGDRATDFRMDGKLPMADPFSGGVWFDEKEGVFKVWYRAGEWSEHGKSGLYTGYAISRDGKHWEKPDLDVVPGTNVCDTISHDSRAVWLDKQETDPDKRFKSIYVRCGKDHEKYDLRYSADGIHWGETVALSGRVCDRSTVNYNPFRRKWIASIRVFAPMQPSIRCRAYAEDNDLESLIHRVHWFQNELDFVRDSMLTCYTSIDRDEVLWFGIDEDELRHPDPTVGPFVLPAIYNFDATAYESVMVGEYSVWRGPENNVCSERGIQKLTEFCLGYSRDGFHYARPDKEAVMESRQEPGAWNYGNMQPAIGNPCIVGDSLYLYTGGHMLNDVMWDGWTSTGLGILRRDGFVSMRAEGDGCIVTPPVSFDGKYLFVNAEADAFAVEVLDADGKPIKGYERSDCKPMKGVNGTRIAVKWKHRKDLAPLAGRPVRFKFYVNSGDIYSFWVSLWKTGESRGFLGGGGPGLNPLGIDLPLNLPESEARRHMETCKAYPMPAVTDQMTFQCTSPTLQWAYELIDRTRKNPAMAVECWRRYLELNGVPALCEYNPELCARMKEKSFWSDTYGLKSAAEWFVAVPGGIKPLEEDGSVISVNPSRIKSLEWARSTYDTSYGRVIVSWDNGGGETSRMYIYAPKGVRIITPDVEFDGDGTGRNFPDLTYPW